MTIVIAIAINDTNALSWGSDNTWVGKRGVSTERKEISVSS